MVVCSARKARGHPVTAGTGLEHQREQILELAALHGCLNVRVFGSRARGDATPDSDVDLLVDVEPGRSMLDIVGLWQDLTALLRCQVDLVTEGGLSPYLRERVYAEARPL
jgi:predicted nucleotidyltransferase